MCLRRGEQKRGAQSSGSSKRAHAGGNLGESHHVILQLCYIFKSQPEALVPCLWFALLINQLRISTYYYTFLIAT